MISRILDLLLGRRPPHPLPEADARHLLGALAVRIAMLDNELALSEVQSIDSFLAKQFKLGPVEAAKMRADCERLAAALPATEQLGPMLNASLSPDERIALTQMMRNVAEADGCMNSSEAEMIQAVTALLNEPAKAGP